MSHWHRLEPDGLLLRCPDCGMHCKPFMERAARGVLGWWQVLMVGVGLWWGLT